MNKARIINMYKLEITKVSNVSPQKHIKKYPQYLVMSLMLIMIGIVGFGIISGEYIGLSSELIKIYNPITSLYSDKHDLQFATSNNYIEESALEYTLPMISSDIRVTNNDIVIKADTSIMIKSVEAGVVSEIGTSLNNVKYIKIKHTEEI
jgi:hypothetical protein